MPLDSENKIDSDLVTDYVSPTKDVDGYEQSKNKFHLYFLTTHSFLFIYSLHTINEGRTAIGNLTSFIPCTPNGCIELIKRSGITIAGANAVVVGKYGDNILCGKLIKFNVIIHINYTYQFEL